MRLFALALMSCLLCAGTVAQAQDETDREQARSLGDRALALYEQKSYAEAYERFEMADRLLHAPTLVLFMARCKRELGELDVARELLQRVVDEPLGEDAPPQFFKAQAMARSELEALPVTTGPVATEPVEPVEPVEPAPGVVPASLSEPDDRGGAEQAGSEPWLLPAILSLSVGAAGLGAGIATGLLAKSAIDDVKSRCDGNTCLPADEGAAADAKVVADVSTAMFVIGGVAAAVGVTLVIWQPGSTDGEEVALRFGPGSMVLGGQF